MTAIEVITAMKAPKSSSSERPETPKRPERNGRDTPSQGRSGHGSDSMLAHLRYDRKAKAAVRAAKQVD